MRLHRLTFDDVDWRAATIAIAPGKGRRADCLPLPAYIAKALVDYMRHGRPETRARFIFVHHRAPLGRGGSTSLVRSAVRLAYARVGLDARFTGTRVLRHTAATRILRNGGSMKEVADVLRHRRLDTRAVYAKVDLPMLADVALPVAWEGAVMKPRPTMVMLVEDYLARRRSLGFALQIDAGQLRSFARSADAHLHGQRVARSRCRV